MYEDAHGSAAAGRGDRPDDGRADRQRVALWRCQLRLLSSAVLRRPVLLPDRVDPASDVLQAGLRHGYGEAVGHLLSDRTGDGHEEGVPNLLPQRVQDL